MGICIKEALRVIKSNINKISYEVVPIENSNKQIIAEDIYAKYSLPTFNNSAMDGYGVKLCDQGEIVKVCDTILAGSSKETQIESSQTIKVMTGARVPSSVEAVIPFELVETIDESHIRLPTGLQKNQHMRFIGEDILKDEKIISDGEEINFSSITILASQGITHVKVYRKPKVSVFTSGEELKLHYEKIKDYQIFNSNTPTILSRVSELGCDVSFAGMAKDTVESLKEMIGNSLHADFIITTGGISVGEADFTQEAFEQFDMDILLNGISIKPGKPTIFGKLGNSYILNLPGNPLAAALIFEVFGTIIIQKLSGSKDIFHNFITTKLSGDLKNKKGRTTIIPGWFDGEYFTPSEKRFPGMVGVLHKCNSMIILNKNQTGLLKDDMVKVIPINWKFYTDIQKDFFN
jgi:molybdopterin molybdotransferase